MKVGEETEGKERDERERCGGELTRVRGVKSRCWGGGTRGKRDGGSGEKRCSVLCVLGTLRWC